MSQPEPARPAKLVIGLFMQDKSLLAAPAAELVKRFGSIDMVSPWFPFDFTNYYLKEMGDALYRRILVFGPLIKQSRLAEIKRFTNEIEKEHAHNGRRQVNIDPGYLLQERFVLATGKNFAHRIYVGDGIYADLTLVYQKKGYKPLPWTYPDYAHASMCSFLGQIRDKYIIDLKAYAEGK